MKQFYLCWNPDGGVPRRQHPTYLQACCAHSIVSSHKIPLIDGSYTDAWACCDCGTQFMPALELSRLSPMPSHLHRKCDRLAAELATRDAMMTDTNAKLRAALAKANGEGSR